MYIFVIEHECILEVNTNFIENIIPCKWYGGFHMTRPNCLVIHICDLMSENQQLALLILVIQWLTKSAKIGTMNLNLQR